MVVFRGAWVLFGAQSKNKHVFSISAFCVLLFTRHPPNVICNVVRVAYNSMLPSMSLMILQDCGGLWWLDQLASLQGWSRCQGRRQLGVLVGWRTGLFIYSFNCKFCDSNYNFTSSLFLVNYILASYPMQAIEILKLRYSFPVIPFLCTPSA